MNIIKEALAASISASDKDILTKVLQEALYRIYAYDIYYCLELEDEEPGISYGEQAMRFIASMLSPRLAKLGLEVQDHRAPTSLEIKRQDNRDVWFSIFFHKNNKTDTDSPSRAGFLDRTAYIAIRIYREVPQRDWNDPRYLGITPASISSRDGTWLYEFHFEKKVGDIDFFQLFRLAEFI